MVVTGDYIFAMMFFGGLVLLGMAKGRILVAMADALLWFALGLAFWTNAWGTSIGTGWTQVLGWVFFILTCVPLLMQMDTEIIHEAQGKKWSEYGSKPKQKMPTSYESYKAALHERVQRGASRRR